MNNKKLLIKIIATIFLLTIMMVNPSNSTKAKFNNSRIYGKDRIETSINISKEGWKNGSDVVIIAQGFNYADALCSSPLAKKYNAPLLLTNSSKLTDSSINEIKRLKPKNVIIIGGPKVISEVVETQLENLKIKDVKRIYGLNRYETSLKIAENIRNSKEVFLTSGNGYADSLSVAAIAAKKGVPILFAEKNNINDNMNKFIQDRCIEKIYVIGGESIISNKAISSLKNTERIYGKDRFETNAKVIEKFKYNLNFEKIYMVQGAGPKGNEFADALSASVLAAKSSAPIILTYKDINESLKNIVISNLTSLSEKIAIGGEKIVPSKILDKLQLENIKVINIDKENSNFGSEKETNIVDGDLIVNASNTTIKNTNVKGVVIINSGYNGNVNVKNVIANTLIVKSGSEQSIHFNNSKINTLIVNSKNNVRLELNDNTKINNTYIRSSTILDNIKGDFGIVTISETDDDNKIEFKGNFNELVEIGSKVNAEFDGEFINLVISSDAKVNVKKDSKINNISANIKCSINIEDGAIVNKVEKSNNDVEIKGVVKEITSSEIKTSCAGGSSTKKEEAKRLPDPKNDEFKIIIFKDNGKGLILDKNLKLEKGKNALEYLESIAKVTQRQGEGFINGINGILNKKANELTLSQRKRGILGVDWFIYINGTKSDVGIKSIEPREKDIIKIDYHEWDWHEVAPEASKIPIKILKVPDSINAGEKIKLRVTCVYQAIYDATVKVDGKEVARTDLEGYATIHISSSGTHTIRVEKEDGYVEKDIKVNGSSSGGSSGGSSSTTKEVIILETTNEEAPIKITKNNKNINIKVSSLKYNNKVITITLFDVDKNLRYIGQAVTNNGQAEFNTKLTDGKYFGNYRVDGLGKLDIPSFQLK